MARRIFRRTTTNMSVEPSVLEPLFVDTSYVLALINRRDQNHTRAQELARQFAGHPLVITNVILFEVGNALCSRFRAEAAQAIREFQTDPLCELVWLTPDGACIEKVGGQFLNGDRSPIQLAWMELTMEC